MTFELAISSLTISFVISMLLSRYLYKNADRFSRNRKIYKERVKLHGKGVPRLGGISVYCACYLTLLILYITKRAYFRHYELKFLGIFLASTLLMAYGVYDDLIRRISYRIKFAIQILAALIIIACGYQVSVVTNPLNGEIYIGLFLGTIFVVLWMLIIMNSINLIDGLDGLACGISIIVCFSFFVIDSYRGAIFSTLLIVPIIGGALAFLRYNFYPAKLFLGDSGSIFLGFILGVLAIESSTKRSTVISLIVPLLTLFIPVAGVIFTFSRRIAYAKNPFKPDKMHLHYRFLKAGISHPDVVLIYYTLTFIYATLGTFCFFMPKKFELAIIVFAVVTMWILYMWALHFVNIRGKLRRKKVKDQDSV